MAGNDSEEALTALMSRKTAVSLFEGKALGLDKAILHSIDCCCKRVWGPGERSGARLGCGFILQHVHSKTVDLLCADIVRY